MPEISRTELTGIIDFRIGNAIRMLRIMRGLSQESLARKLGVTFQQVQKYEKARTHVSSSRLYAIAHVLNAPIEAFFSGPESAQDGKWAIRDMVDLYNDLSSQFGYREFVELNLAYVTLPDPEIRAAVLNLIGEIVRSSSPAPARACRQRKTFRSSIRQCRQSNDRDRCNGPDAEEAGAPNASHGDQSGHAGAID